MRFVTIHFRNTRLRNFFRNISGNIIGLKVSIYIYIYRIFSFCLFDEIFMLFWYENQFFFPLFEAYKSVEFDRYNTVQDGRLGKVGSGRQ